MIKWHRASGTLCMLSQRHDVTAMIRGKMTIGDGTANNSVLIGVPARKGDRENTLADRAFAFAESRLDDAR